MSQLMSKLGQIVSMIDEAEPDMRKFERGNATAGIRVRAKMQDIRRMAKSVRVDIQSIKKVRKAEKHAKKTDRS